VFESATPGKAAPLRAAADARRPWDRGALERSHPSDDPQSRPSCSAPTVLHSAGDGATVGNPCP